MMEVVVLIKMLDGEGQVRYREFKTNTLHSIEALGMVTTMADTLRASIMGNARGRPSS